MPRLLLAMLNLCTKFEISCIPFQNITELQNLKSLHITLTITSFESGLLPRLPQSIYLVPFLRYNKELVNTVKFCPRQWVASFEFHQEHATESRRAPNISITESQWIVLNMYPWNQNISPSPCIMSLYRTRANPKQPHYWTMADSCHHLVEPENFSHWIRAWYQDISPNNISTIIRNKQSKWYSIAGNIQAARITPNSSTIYISSAGIAAVSAITGDNYPQPELVFICHLLSDSYQICWWHRKIISD